MLFLWSYITCLLPPSFCFVFLSSFHFFFFSFLPTISSLWPYSPSQNFTSFLFLHILPYQFLFFLFPINTLPFSVTIPLPLLIFHTAYTPRPPLFLLQSIISPHLSTASISFATSPSVPSHSTPPPPNPSLTSALYIHLPSSLQSYFLFFTNIY